MKQTVIAAIIVAVGLVLAAFLSSGRYHVTRLDADTVIRTDRWTGETKVIEAYPDEAWLREGRISN